MAESPLPTFPTLEERDGQVQPVLVSVSAPLGRLCTAHSKARVNGFCRWTSACEHPEVLEEGWRMGLGSGKPPGIHREARCSPLEEQERSVLFFSLPSWDTGRGLPLGLGGEYRQTLRQEALAWCSCFHLAATSRPGGIREAQAAGRGPRESPCRSL